MSRLRLSRGGSKAKAAKTPAAPKTRASAAAGRRPGVLVQSPKSDIFVALLGVALGAIVIACLLMLLTLWRHDFKVNAKLAVRDGEARVIQLASQPSRPAFGHLKG